MQKADYFRYALTTDYVLKIDWYYSFLSILTDEVIDTKYIRTTAGKLEVLVGDTWEELTDVRATPIFELKDQIKLTNQDLENIEGTVDTTVGRAIANKILLTVPFGKKMPYINAPFSVSDIEKKTAEGLSNGSIKVSEYIKLSNGATFLGGLSMLTNVAATPKNILPPPGLAEFKKKTKEEFDKKYGPDWIKDRTKCVEFQEELKRFDSEWLKDDPTLGKLLNKKIKDNARVKMYLTFGPEVGFNKDGSEMTFIENSLMDQYPEDKKQISAMFNSSRSGSFDRGNETQKGGAAAKDILRATSSYNISGDNCGSNIGLTIEINKENASGFKNRYQIVGNKLELITDPSALIGKTIVVRSPMYCKNNDSSYCKKCVGETMGDYKNGLSLSVLNISNILLNTSMKSMHNTQVSLLPFDINAVVS